MNYIINSFGLVGVTSVLLPRLFAGWLIVFGLALNSFFPFELATPPGFEATHNPKGNLV